MAKIVIVDDDPQVISYEADFFESIEENNEIAVYKTRPSNWRDLLERVKDCHTIVVTKATTQITNSVIENSPNLRHIAVYDLFLIQNLFKKFSTITLLLP